MKKFIFLFTFIFLFSILSGQEADYKGFPEWTFQQEGVTQYYLYTPDNLQPGEKYPIALFLHGCCGDSYDASLRNAVDPPVRMWHNFGKNEQKTPTYILAPATSSGWSQHFGNLKTAIDDLIENAQGDSTRIYITGFSMGGRGTWDFINQYPNYFAAAMPMGMNFSGNPSTIKDIPIWTNRGQLDGHASDLHTQVGTIRELNDDNRGGLEWVTGVNPRFTSFEGVGHGVQWDACSSQDLVGWALSKVNDGNKYPHVRFVSPTYKQEFNFGENVDIEIAANDPDGTIQQIVLMANGMILDTLTSEPYTAQAAIHAGDNLIQAIATDDNGKSSTANIVARTDNFPAFITAELPDTRQGSLYERQLFAQGNAPFTFRLSHQLDSLPMVFHCSKTGF